jgi:hypothetical protein
MWSQIAINAILFIIDLFVKDKAKKKKFVDFIESQVDTVKLTGELRDDYNRQRDELEKRSKDSDTSLH